MSQTPLLTRKSTTEIRKMVRKKLEKEPDLFGTTRVEAEILRGHLMKARISLGAAGSIPTGGISYTIFADEPAVAGGEGSAPFMFGYFMAGTLLCELAQYTWNAAELELVDVIRKIEMSLEGGFHLAPLYGNDDRPGASAVKEMRVVTRIEADAPREQIEKLARLAAARCPAHQTVRNGVPYVNVVELNGEKIAEFRDV